MVAARILRSLGLAFGCLSAGLCFAAESSEFVDSAANVLAIFIIVAMPIGGIVLFWLVHILPEKVAEKRHHPQKDAIKTLCLLSLLFGGMLWPLAWLWAYSKPVMYKLAYGRDKHDDFYTEEEPAASVAAGAPALQPQLRQIRQEFEDLEKRGELPSALASIRDRLAQLEAQATPPVQSAKGAG